MRENKDMLSNWLETQEKMFGFWQEAYKQFDPTKMTEVFVKQAEIFSGKNGGFSFSNPYDWATANTTAETMGKMFQAGNVYGKLYTFWNDFSMQMTGEGKAEQYNQLTGEMLANYNKVLEAFFGAALPEPVLAVVKGPAEVCEMYQDTCRNLAGPWIESGDELKEKLTGAMQGDNNAHTEFLQLWLETYQKACGKVLGMPIFGLSRESVEKTLGGVDTYVRYVTSTHKFNATLYKVGQETMERLTKSISELAGKGSGPETFKDFYKLWWQTNEDAYAELFKSEGFAEILGEMVDAGVSFKKNTDGLLVDMITQALPIATDKEVDSLAKGLQQVKRRVREQAKELRLINEKLDALMERGGEEE